LFSIEEHGILGRLHRSMQWFAHAYLKLQQGIFRSRRHGNTLELQSLQCRILQGTATPCLGIGSLSGYHVLLRATTGGSRNTTYHVYVACSM
jgi:hypothetical protein